MCLKSGDILHNRYQIQQQIGRGGFGKTYTAKDLTSVDAVICVVKEITVLGNAKEEVKQEIEKRFQREAKSLAQLGEHPQIPQLYAYFEVQGTYYLVQEYIEGEDLSEEIAPNQPFFTEAEVVELLRDVLEVLAFVHENHRIHRDIKPSNLRRRKSDGKLVLLDFGAVKELGTIAIANPADSQEFNLTQAIGTPGYMSPEQNNGNPQFSSDLYSLGMICIQALTGTHPRNLPSDPNTGDSIWRYSTAEREMLPIGSDLEHFLNKMVRYVFHDRFENATEALDTLKQITGESPRRKSNSSSRSRRSRSRTTNIPAYAWILGSITAIAAIVGIGQLPRWMPATCPVIQGDDLSCGEETLMKTFATDEKAQGVAAYAQGHYLEAVDWFQAARQRQPSDPETLIYLNNAQVEARKAPFYTLAVAVPLGNPADAGDSGREILRGVAQLQTEINEKGGIKGRGLRILIANDANDSDRAQQIAQKIAKQPQILGVIGHNSSDNTRSALPFYRSQQLVLISPTSTAQNLAQENSLFFRTVPKDSVNAEALAEYLFHQAKQTKAIVFYNPNSAYSRSLHERFLLSFDRQGGQVVKQVDLATPIFDAEAAIAQGQQRGATILVLFPDAKSNPYAFLNALKVVRANHNRYQLVGGDSFYTTDLLQERKLATGMIISIPWNFLAKTNPVFNKQVETFWGGNVSWRTATAYDAAKVWVTALASQPAMGLGEQIKAIFDPTVRRVHLYQVLKKPTFQAEGATGTIRFETTGDRLEPVVQLVKIIPSRCSPYGYLFIPIQFKTDQAAGLNCS